LGHLYQFDTGLNLIDRSFEFPRIDNFNLADESRFQKSSLGPPTGTLRNVASPHQASDPDRASGLIESDGEAAESQEDDRLIRVNGTVHANSAFAVFVGSGGL
jgi:hypothetical protein